MVKDDTLLMIAAIGVGAVILYKPLQKAGGAIADTVSDVGGGIGTGVQGIGTGVQSAFTGVGSGISDIAGGISSPYGFIEDWFGIQEQKSQLRFQAQEQLLFEKYGLQAQENLMEQQGDIVRQEATEEFKSSWWDFLTPTPAETGSAILGSAAWIKNKLAKKDKKEATVDKRKQEIAQKFKGDLGIWEAFGQLEGREIKRPETAAQKRERLAQSSPELQANLDKLGWTKKAKKTTRAKKKATRTSSKKSTGLKISRVKNWSKLSSRTKKKLKKLGYK